MSKHIELYKKYRPTRWEQLVGQEKVAASLRAAVKRDKIPTAYGFFGPRGCGKTSAAMILAKAANCPDLDDKGNPCNVCETCISIDNNTQVGVNYISMANNGSVDDIREIVKNAQLRVPIKRQVWILDEVHNLSRAAFDALLIPIEDKNMSALFILCSTEADKIPQTILSRVQSRRFSLVGSENMKKLLKNILQTEGLSLDDNLISDAVRQGRGSVRDTITSLETVVETGEVSTSVHGRLIEALAARDASKAFTVIAEGTNDGYDGRDMAEELFSCLRDIIIRSSVADRSIVSEVPVHDPKAVFAGLGKTRGAIDVASIIGKSISEMSMGADSRIYLEIAVMEAIGHLKENYQPVRAQKTTDN